MPRTFVYKNETKRDEMELKVFGKKIEEQSYGDLAGDIANTAIVNVSFEEERPSLGKVYPVCIRAKNTVCSITLRFEKAEIDLSEIKVFEQRLGTGRKTIKLLAKTAANFGFKRLYGHAIRYLSENPDRIAVGYYVFPRLGFEADIPADVQVKLPTGLKGKTTLSELMKSKEGRAFWKDEGKTIDVYFDLDEGSVSWEVLGFK